MNHSNDLENLEDKRALRRQHKKRPRMKVHGQSLKKPTPRTALHIAKLERKKRQ